MFPYRAVYEYRSYVRVCLRRVRVIYGTSNRFRSYTPGFRFAALTRHNVRRTAAVRFSYTQINIYAFFLFRVPASSRPVSLVTQSADD